MTLLGFLAGALVAFLAMRVSRSQQATPISDVGFDDLGLLMELLRRAHGSAAACLTFSDYDPVWAMTRPQPSLEVLDWTVAAARFAMGDGRDHVLSEGETVVAAGDGQQVGGALVFYAAEVDTIVSDAAINDLRKIFARLGAHMPAREDRESGGEDLPEWLVGGPESLEGISFQLCNAVLDVSRSSNALVLKDLATQAASVIAISDGTDRRLLGAPISADAAVGRACQSDVPIVGADSKEFLGSLRADRRRQTTGGIAFPLWDGRECIGALALFGDHSTMAPNVRDQVQWLVKNAGPRIGRASALRNAETRAMTDPLTGLPNRRALERAMHNQVCGPCSILWIDLDHFKALNDTYGHAAGDAALRHVAAIFRATLRSCDLPARVGGEEFALWLPGAPASKALEIANRVREAVRESPLTGHGGDEVRITCSIGVASVPENVSQVDNLLGAADVAMYRAKELGRDRVEVAQPRHS